MHYLSEPHDTHRRRKWALLIVDRNTIGLASFSNERLPVSCVHLCDYAVCKLYAMILDFTVPENKLPTYIAFTA